MMASRARPLVRRGAPIALLAVALVPPSPAAEPHPAAPSSYAAEIRAWRDQRVRRLRAEDGWLTLVGLHWLRAGENPFGTDPSNAIVLPAGAAPDSSGSFFLENGTVRVKARPGAAITLAGREVTDRALRSDADGKPDEIQVGRLRLYVIRRGDRLGIRVKDPQSPSRTGFKGIDSFPPDAAWRIEGEFVPFATAKEIRIPTVLGTTEKMSSPGQVRFTAGGRRLTLEPVLEDPSSDQLFFIFRDRTSGVETYEAGRFLYADLPKDGKVILDFNKAYNPPCAFTPFATCPLPPRSNWLPIRVEAGEKAYAGGAH